MVFNFHSADPTQPSCVCGGVLLLQISGAGKEVFTLICFGGSTIDEGRR